MATALHAFTNHEFGTIRTVTSGGQVLFYSKDLATALGYANTKDALARHYKGVVNHYPLETAGGIQQVRFMSEGDLYRLIVSSKLPAAQQFEAWVFDDVLPSIRRHGMYAIDELLNDDEFLGRAIATLRAERAKRLVAEQTLLEAEPKVSYCDVVLASPSLITTTEIAKDYGLSAKKLNQILREEQNTSLWKSVGYTPPAAFRLTRPRSSSHLQWRTTASPMLDTATPITKVSGRTS